jgi:hypothetical protein
LGAPLTRPITITVHEQVYDAIKEAADAKTKGSVSKYLRLLLYTDLVENKHLPISFLEGLYAPRTS